MNEKHLAFFGFQKEPFGTETSISDIFQTDDLIGVKKRFEYAVGIGAIGLITGDVGSGKSTSLRYSMSFLHKSEYKTLFITATSGSIIEIYRQISAELGFENPGSSKATLVRLIKSDIMRLVLEKKQKVVLIIDEASLLRLDVLVELHTICQFKADSKAWLPIILAGQSNLIDKLQYPGSLPLASRVVARSHLEGIEIKIMKNYLSHRLQKAGMKTNLFEDEAVTAIFQGSGGLFRKANHLARGSLIAACRTKNSVVLAPHVQTAASEVF
jgi:general secretion pathway protein A